MACVSGSFALIPVALLSHLASCSGSGRLWLMAVLMWSAYALSPTADTG